MDEFEMRRMIYDNIKEICHFSQMQVFATSSYQRNYFQLQIDELISGLINFIQVYVKEKYPLVETFSAQENNQENVQEGVQKGVQESAQGGVQEGAKESVPGNANNLREITKEELTYNDGSDGRGAYVAVKGIVYDVSDAIRWAGGTHFGLYAGQDLTNQFMGCHNGMVEILKILPVAGTLKT